MQIITVMICLECTYESLIAVVSCRAMAQTTSCGPLVMAPGGCDIHRMSTGPGSWLSPPHFSRGTCLKRNPKMILEAMWHNGYSCHMRKSASSWKICE